jgi:Uncharacterised protein conserved in bacteria (DUF2336)
MAASEKLSHLLQLADQGPALRMALAEEVTELLADWPSDYPENMRDVCEALLAKAARDVDTATRARLRAQLASHPDLTQRLLPHGSQALVQAARNGEDLTALLAESLSVKDETARQILDDDSGATLAVACKGANIDRAVFSTVALLMRLRRDRSHAFAVLNAFDDVPMGEASRVLQGWR